MNIFQQTLRCTFCQKLFDKRNILKRHYREKHFCGNVYKCNMCTVSFVRKERLIRHLKSVHFNIKYKCEECGMNFVEKYKQNFHLVHSHGYAYCSACKLAYRTFRPMEQFCSTRDLEGETKTETNEFEHVCSIYIQFYKCFIGNCKGKKIYNRLNFFIRHLQLEHQIIEFQKVREIIDQSTFETKCNKTKSKIRAKTLEGHHDEIISDDLKELFDYAKLNIIQSENYEDYPSANDIIKKLTSEKEFGDQKESEVLLMDDRYPLNSQIEEVRIKEEEAERVTVMDSNGNPSLKELIQNINIMCMMENNYKKYLNIKVKDEELTCKKLESEEITLGKRGRPSKISTASSFCLAETVVETFLNKFEEMDQKALQKPIKRQNQIETFEKETKEKKHKDKKKIKPIFFDDILLETLNITDRVKRKESLFSVKRNCIFYQINGKIDTREGLQPFIQAEAFNIALKIASSKDFEEYFIERDAFQKSFQKPVDEYNSLSQIDFKLETWECSKCRLEFYNYLAFLQHSGICNTKNSSR